MADWRIISWSLKCRFIIWKYPLQSVLSIIQETNYYDILPREVWKRREQLLKKGFITLITTYQPIYQWPKVHPFYKVKWHRSLKNTLVDTANNQYYIKKWTIKIYFWIMTNKKHWKCSFIKCPTIVSDMKIFEHFQLEEWVQ